MLTFNKNYLGLAIFLVAIEVLIALFARDNFVRPYLGDVLVVILIYCFVQSFFNVPVVVLAMLVLLFSFTIEFLQYLKIVEKLGWENSGLARTLVGTSFAWMDILSYVAGIVIVLLVENYRVKKVVV